MPPSPPREGTIGEIYAAMVALEQPVFEALDADFRAYDFMPDAASVAEWGFPLSFRFPPTWKLQDRSMGSGAEKLLSQTIVVAFLVGLSSNEFGALTAEAEKYIRPFYDLYFANRSIGATVRNLTFGEGYMGDMTINNVKLFGLQLPVTVEQRIHMTSAL